MYGRETMLLVAEPTLGEDEKAALAAAIDSNWITMGGRVRAFEEAFARLHGMPDALAVGSCTAGLHLALEALGIGPGDEVLVPSLSFVATANSVVYCGARPVFVDIESLEEPIISMGEAARNCTPATKAVIVMHYAGYMADLPAWRRFADERGLILVEDSAHALGEERGPILGDAAVFSFYGNKNMTTAEGGMILAPNPAVLERIRQTRAHGMTTGTFQRLHSRLVTYDVTMLGYNYRMDELRAAVGLVQLERLPEWNGKRRMLAQLYRDRIAELCPAVSVPFAPDRRSTHHVLPALLPPDTDRQLVVDKLRKDGIQTTNHYPPTHWFSWYMDTYPSPALPNTEDFATRELTLPLHPKLERGHVDWVVRALAAAVA
ncbi:MAG: DegT/DnrJ/EryC1/StrS family aminotransferase [Acetobacteraceae bacterium]|nr:DegT/DnrJ/EryC1/StrS family aminotransferase [Acetobacteraceae bacterium]